MVMFKHILSMMYNKKVSLWAVICSVIFLLGCVKEEPVVEKCVINGTINHSHPNGVKVTLESVTDPSLKYIAVSDANGAFEFQDVLAGTYSVDAIKDGFGWVWMVDDGVVNHKDRLIELIGGRTKELTIYLNGGAGFLDFLLELTDISGNPIEDYVYVPKYSTMVSFRLYNRTDRSHSWSVSNIDRCFVTDDRGINLEYTFSSFSPTSGTLEPGESVVLVGRINQEIFNVYTNYPYYSINELDFFSGWSKTVSLDIEF